MVYSNIFIRRILQKSFIMRAKCRAAFLAVKHLAAIKHKEILMQHSSKNKIDLFVHLLPTIPISKKPLLSFWDPI